MHEYQTKKEAFTVTPPSLETPGHYNIRTILYFLTHTTSEGIIMSDEHDFKHLFTLIRSATDDTTFDALFPVTELVNYRNEDNLPLRGGRRTAWIIQHEVPRGSTTDVEEYLAKRICQIFRQETLYNAANKLYDMLSSKFITSRQHELSTSYAAVIAITRKELANFLGKTPA